MNKDIVKNTNYFKRLRKILLKINNKFLFYIPDLYKRDFRKDKIPSIEIKQRFIQKLFSKNYLYEDLGKVKKAKICFISHYIGHKEKDKDYDFYYGDLFKKLKIPFYILIINHTNESLKEIKKNYSKSKITRVYLDSNFSFISDILIMFKIISEFIFFSVNKMINFNQLKFFNKDYFSFNFKFFFNSRFTYKISNQIIKVLNNSSNLNYLMTTYEGHAFEKIIFKYCKKNNIKSYGYFFSVIREYKNSIYHKFIKNYEPDKIFTSGNVSKNDLILNSNHKNIETLGNDKKLYKKKKFRILSKKNKDLTILVCPEGLFTETRQLLNLINDKTLQGENFKFIFRIHPIFKSSNILKNVKINKNIIFSKEKNIEDDFKKSDIILYSGSSVCIHATMQGLAPLNYRNKDYTFSLDPLYRINNFITYDSIDLKLNIHQILKKRFSIKYNQELESIRKYCFDYFKKIDYKILLQSMNQNSKKIKLKR